MKQTRLIMGMPITVWLPDDLVKNTQITKQVFDHFKHIDQLFSTYKPTSEISRLNSGELQPSQLSAEVLAVLEYCQELPAQTMGYFNIHRPDGTLDPSGYVKGWALEQAGQLLDAVGLKNYCLEAGGDALLKGTHQKQPWRVGIRSPFEQNKTVKTLGLKDAAIATSGSYIRGSHIYNPLTGQPASELASVTVVGPNISAADVYATTLYAMGKTYSRFLPILQKAGYEVYVVESPRGANFTAGIQRYVCN